MVWLELYALSFCAMCVIASVIWGCGKGIKFFYYRHKFQKVFIKDVPAGERRYVQYIEFGGDKHTFLIFEKDPTANSNVFNIRLGRNGVSTHCWKVKGFLNSVRFFNRLEKNFYSIEKDAYEYILNQVKPE